MKKVYKMKELDCANCAAKMERGISLIDGVKACNVNFIMQKLTLRLRLLLREWIRIPKVSDYKRKRGLFAL